MEPVDRLAAFLAGELSADEHAALEAELARDPGLRADLAALRRADAALGGVAPTELPDGARERLLAALEPVLEAELGDPVGAADGADERPAPVDELAQRRQHANRRSWLVGLGGIAAAAVAVAIVGPVLGGVGGSDDSDGVAAMSADSDVAETESHTDDAAGAVAPVGPTLLGSGRSVDADGVADLLAAGELDAVVARGLSPDDARAVGTSWALALGADPLGGAYAASGQLDQEDSASDADLASELDFPTSGDGAEPDESERSSGLTRDRVVAGSEVGTADVQLLGEVSEADREAVGRCLSTLLTPSGVLVPALAELVSFEGEPAVAFALVGDAADGSVTRREIWVLEREGCEVRYFRQG